MNSLRFKLVSDSSVLLPVDRELFEVSTAMDYSKRDFLAVLQGKRLLAFINYSLKGDNCFIHWIGKSSLGDKYFKRKFKRSSARYLMEYFIKKKKISAFDFTNLTLSGISWTDRLIKHGLCVKENGKLKVTDKWLKEAESFTVFSSNKKLKRKKSSLPIKRTHKRLVSKRILHLIVLFAH